MDNPGFDFNLRRASLMAVLGILLGFITFFRSDSFQGLILGTVGTTYLFGVIGFVSENISGIRKIAAGIIFLLPVVLLSGIFLVSGSMCQMHASPGYEVKQNIFTGEIKHNEYIGASNCADLLPWYYEKLENRERAESEVGNYCQNNNQSRVCKTGVDQALRMAGYQ